MHWWVYTIHHDSGPPTLFTIHADLMESSGLSEEGGNRRVSDIHIEEISRLYCKRWKLLCPHLEMEGIIVSDVDHTGNDEREKRRAFLAAWKENKGSGATYRRLLYALLKIGCREDAEAVCKLYRQATL